jgi:anti-sigma factor RsiW
MSDCRMIRDRLSRYCDNELSPPERRLVEDHLKQCSRCSAELQQIYEIVAAFHEGMPTPPVPSDLTQRIMERARTQAGIAAWERNLLGFWGRWSFSMRFATVAVAAAACYLGIVIGGASHPSRRQAGDEMKWIDMSSRGPIVTAYVGRTR